MPSVTLMESGNTAAEHAFSRRLTVRSLTARATPFSVVSGTTLRFVSLVAAIIGTGTYAFGLVYTLMPANARQGELTYARCNELRRRAPVGVGLDDASIAAAEEHLAAVNRCVAPFEQAQGRWMLAGLALLLGLAAVLYLTAPWWIRRRSRLVPVTAAGFPQLHASLRPLSAAMGLRREPVFALDVARAAAGGLAFGSIGRYTVRINAGLVPLRVTDPAAFQAIVAHELAHIRNRDIDIAHATIALWRAFVAVALIPLLIVTVYPNIMIAPGVMPWTYPAYPATALNHLGRTAIFVLVVYLSRNAVLRTREMYADVRASQHAPVDGLRRAVSAAADRPGRWWQRGNAVHPTAQARLSAIGDPLILLRPRFGELFGIGVTTMLATSSLMSLVDRLTSADGAPGHRYVAWLIAPVTIGMITAAAWRAEALALHRHRPPLLPAALGFTLGLIVGDLASVLNPVGTWSIFGISGSAGHLVFAESQEVGAFSLSAALVAAALLTCGVICQTRLSAAGARAWLPGLRGAGTRVAWLAGTAVTAALFAVWFGIWLDVRAVPFLVGRVFHLTPSDFASVGEVLWPGPGWSVLATNYVPLQQLIDHPVALPAIAAAWLYPLAARRRRRPAGDAPALSGRPGTDDESDRTDSMPTCGPPPSSGSPRRVSSPPCSPSPEPCCTRRWSTPPGCPPTSTWP